MVRARPPTGARCMPYYRLNNAHIYDHGMHHCCTQWSTNIFCFVRRSQQIFMGPPVSSPMLCFCFYYYGAGLDKQPHKDYFRHEIEPSTTKINIERQSVRMFWHSWSPNGGMCVLCTYHRVTWWYHQLNDNAGHRMQLCSVVHYSQFKIQMDQWVQ